MTILLTGGTGTTSSLIAKLCLSPSTPFLIASRKAPETAVGKGVHALKFVWEDPSTFPGVFNYELPGGEKIDTVYLIAPVTTTPVDVVGPFIEMARERGVKKFVLFTGSSCERGGWGPGKIWDFLEEGKKQGEVVVVLRATWFMDNFHNWQHGITIKNENAIYSACGDGKIPFVSANDIAKMAFEILTKPGPWEASYRVPGGEQLTFDQVAQTISRTLGREVKLVWISEEDCRDRYIKTGIPAQTAGFLAMIEVGTAGGSEAFEGNDFEIVTGGKPQSFGEWVEENQGRF